MLNIKYARAVNRIPPADNCPLACFVARKARAPPFGSRLGATRIGLAAATYANVCRLRHNACNKIRRRLGRKQGAVSLSATASEDKLVWFIRHGQAEHNVLYESGDAEGCMALMDPALTAKGQDQATNVAEDPLLKPYLAALLDQGGVDLVVSSPLCRTVETALFALAWWTKARQGRKIVLNADLQETGSVNCDKGSPLSALKASFAEQAESLDFDLLWSDWEIKEGDFEDTGSALHARLERFRNWLASRPERRIVVVSHHNLLAAMLGVTFMNCEVRQFALKAGKSWDAVQPLLSSRDEELSEAEIKHLKVYDPMIRRHFGGWGFSAPVRFR